MAIRVMRTYVHETELQRLEDDGCPNVDNTPYVAADESPTPGIIRTEWGDQDYRGVRRLYSCERCGWFVWHPLSYCYKCPGKMRILKGTTKQLQEHMRKHGYEDGGF